MTEGLLFLLTFALTSVAAGLLLSWGRLPGTWRTTIALLTSAAGLIFLVMAVRTEGVREASTTTMFLIGQSYVTEQASASASLPYYVMTAVCLLVGTLGLAVGEDASHALSRHWLATAIALSLGLTALRFALEKMAAPHELTYAVGIIWLPPVVGAYFAYNLRREGKGVGPLLLSLLVYSLVVRGAVAALVILATSFHLGSHYDITSLVKVWSPLTHHAYHFDAGSLDQILWVGVFPQLVFWPVLTLAAGLLGSMITWLAMSPGPSGEPVRDRATMVAAGEDR